MASEEVDFSFNTSLPLTMTLGKSKLLRLQFLSYQMERSK